ncbi:hypothetical protein LZ009_17175 [Ramlibacter sp. XY19]|uniref:hypothetical protein n=1 Tax=Ramlibacter paludis TaxID=2908000 RepID=UPI0023D9A214|nr:hypothetical protein [Ramlibacter paludis]MCG2594511.1 hypothetical protein [Ramlibacter paludis]
MGTLAPSSLVAGLLQLLPGPLLRSLDRWSHRRAVSRQLQRQEAWLARKAPATPPAVPLLSQYKLKPWRD